MSKIESAVVAAAVVAAGVFCAPTANADPSAYLKAMEEAGIYNLDGPGGVLGRQPTSFEPRPLKSRTAKADWGLQ